MPSAFLEDLEGRLEPWLTAWPASDLKLLAEAVARMVEPLASIIEAGWTPILSPAEFPNSEDFTKPAYPQRFNPAYLGQFVGVTVPTQNTYSQAISLVKEEPGFFRCTSEAITKAVARALKEGAVVRILSRQNANGEAKGYWFVVVVRGADVEGSITTTGNVTKSAATIKNIPSTAGMAVGDPVIALGFPPTATINEVNSSTELTLSTSGSITMTDVQLVVVDSTGVTAVENNLVEAKPAGLRWELLIGGIYLELEEGYATYKALEEAFATYATLEVV